MRVELWVAVISGLAAVGSAVIAYQAQTSVTDLEHQFRSAHDTQLAQLNAEHERELELLRSQLAQQHERRQPFLERQMRHYFEAVAAASKLATLEDGPDRTEALEQFWHLYWGPLAVVEDSAVERAMVNFGRGLSENLERTALRQRALQLAHACRDSLQKLWDTDLGQLQNLRGAN
jgi:hypothetical protein